jgi:hypothetical protein
LNDKQFFESMMKNFFGESSHAMEYASAAKMNKFIYCRFTQTNLDNMFACSGHRSCKEYIFIV